VTTASELAADFRDAVRPLQRRFHSNRTVSAGKAGILAQLLEYGPATASELAAAERVSPQAAAFAVKELERLGFVIRTTDDSDRRRVRIEITDVGREGLRRERSAGVLWLAQAIADRLDAQELAVLASAIPVLRKLTAEPTRE
jgi:DNA-binding MarR family transcriptional regulator